jgi:ribosomal protein L10
MNLTTKIRKNKEISELKDILFKSPILLFFHLNTLEGIDWLSFKKDLNAFTLTYNVPKTLKNPLASVIDTHCFASHSSQHSISSLFPVFDPVSAAHPGCAAKSGCQTISTQDQEQYAASVVLKTKVVKNTLLNTLLSQSTGWCQESSKQDNRTEHPQNSAEAHKSAGFKGFKGPTLIIYCAPKAEQTLYNMNALNDSTSSYSVNNNVLLHACTGIIQQFLQSISTMGTPHFKHTLIQSNISNCSKSVESAIQQYIILQKTKVAMHPMFASRPSVAPLPKLASYRTTAPQTSERSRSLDKMQSHQSNDAGCYASFGSEASCRSEATEGRVAKGDAKLIPLGILFTHYNKYIPISAPCFVAPEAIVSESKMYTAEYQAYAAAYSRSVANIRYSWLAPKINSPKIASSLACSPSYLCCAPIGCCASEASCRSEASCLSTAGGVVSTAKALRFVLRTQQSQLDNMPCSTFAQDKNTCAKHQTHDSLIGHNTMDYKSELTRVYNMSKYPTIYYQMQLVLSPSLLCGPQQHLIKSLMSNLQALSIIGSPMRKLLQVLHFLKENAISLQR